METTAKALLSSAKLLLPFIIAILLVSCAPIDTKPARPTNTRDVGVTPSVVASPTSAPIVSPSPRATPLAVATLAPTSVPATPTAIAAANGASATRADPTSLIKAVIQKANEAQAQAFNQQNPSLMKDTATGDYYSHLLQINNDLSSSGVASIKLMKLEWGAVTLKNATTAEATTFETWETVFSDGGTQQDRNRNVYQLVLDNGTWKIQSDDHPATAGGSSGGTTPSGVGTPSARPTPPEQIIPAGPGESRNWSGYAADKGSYTSVSGTWTIPQPKTSGVASSAATWVGIGGVRARDLIQAGTEEIILGTGSVRYNAWIEMLPEVSHTVPLVVHPGDSVTVSIVRQSSNDWLITILNNTTSEKFSRTVTYQSSLSSAEWVEEAPSGGRRIVPLEDFGKVTITGGAAVANGKPVTIASSGAKPITMIDARGEAIAQTSSLGPDGSSFTVTRVGPPADQLPVPVRRGRFG